MDGFSNPDQFDDEAMSLWAPGAMEETHLDQTTAKYILSYIGDKFCQMVVTENTAASWVKKDGKKNILTSSWIWINSPLLWSDFEFFCCLYLNSQAGMEASGERGEGDVRRLWGNTLQHPLGLSEMWFCCLPRLLQGQGEEELQRWVFLFWFFR